MITCDITKLSKIKNENTKQTYFHLLILPNDHINQLITFSLGITLSGLHCIATETCSNVD